MANREMKKAICEGRETRIEMQCQEIQGILNRNSKKAFETAKKQSEGPKIQASSTIENEAGEILSDPQQVLDRWKENCNGLYNHSAPKYTVRKYTAVLQDLTNGAALGSPAPEVTRDE